MGIYPSKINRETIKKMYESEDFKSFHEALKKELEIGDVKYNLELRDRVNDQEGYIDISVDGRVSISENWDCIKEVILLEEGLLVSINSNFSKLPGECFARAAEICLKFALVHELVHVQQFKRGLLTRETMEQLKETPYEEREVEIQANNIAREIIGRESEFAKKILGFYNSKKTVDNNDVHYILDLFVNKE